MTTRNKVLGKIWQLIDQLVVRVADVGLRIFMLVGSFLLFYVMTIGLLIIVAGSEEVFYALPAQLVSCLIGLMGCLLAWSCTQD